jgi:(4-(4-[2-(gamma-L-glutamylamino)ethyl]phenoxymethyl)furan-2-yl)methanamine synthase
MATLGLDIGGANLKAAFAGGAARSVPFALWKAPDELAEKLARLLAEAPHDALAVTMTGELCDCFATKREGVHFIVDSVVKAGSRAPVRVWSTAGRFVSVDQARADPWRVASANWHALATFAGRFVPEGSALLMDIGSTTTDIIPLLEGRPVPNGFTDPERLAGGELVYTGVRRTPLCAVLGVDVAAEWFATTLDAYVLLGMIYEDSGKRETADGRPATAVCAHARLARMLCSDTERFTREMADELARRVHALQVDRVLTQMRRVASTLPEQPTAVVVAGEGEFLARTVIECSELPIGAVVSLNDRIGAEASQAACAYAVARLADEL